VVTPDSYVVDKRDGTLLDVYVAEQEKMLVRSEKGNKDVIVPAEKKEMQKISGVQIGELAEICKRIEAHYGFPCDIEWAMEAGVFYIVQSRPITTL
jgi:pyruvate,water dikinase